jgi:hypothetical protein
MVIGGYSWSDGTDAGTLSPYIFDFAHTLFLSFRHLYHHFPFPFFPRFCHLFGTGQQKFNTDLLPLTWFWISTSAFLLEFGIQINSKLEIQFDITSLATVSRHSRDIFDATFLHNKADILQTDNGR